MNPSATADSTSLYAEYSSIPLSLYRDFIVTSLPLFTNFFFGLRPDSFKAF